MIYFGPGFGPEQKFGLPDNAFVRMVEKNDFSALQAVQDEAQAYNSGLIGLDPMFGVGVDIRFAADALVVIVAKELPDSEFCRQMVARGVRSMRGQEGVVFTQGLKEQNYAMSKRLEDDRGADYKDGAICIKAIWSIMEGGKPKKALKEMIKNLGNEWRYTQLELLERQTDEGIKANLVKFIKAPKEFKVASKQQNV